MTKLAHSAQNDTRLADLQNEVREFGRLAAQGKDSLPMFAIKVAYAAADGVISTEKDADGVDDAARLYAEFIKAQSKKAVHEHSPGGVKANASKTRQIIAAAVKPTCDFVDVLNRTVTIFRTMKEADTIKVRSAYPAYVEAARAQIQQDDDLSDAQIIEAVSKPEPKEKTVEGELTRVEKILGALINGDNGLSDQSPEIAQAHQLVEQKLAALMLTREVTETTAKARSLGIVVVEDTPQAVAA